MNANFLKFKTFYNRRMFSIGLAPLREIARAIAAASDLNTTLDLIAHKTTEVMGVDSCTIYLLDPDRETLRLRASTGLAKRAVGFLKAGNIAVDDHG